MLLYFKTKTCIQIEHSNIKLIFITYLFAANLLEIHELHKKNVAFHYLFTPKGAFEGNLARLSKHAKPRTHAMLRADCRTAVRC